MIDKIDKYDVVTFDVFDTLIKRDTYSYRNFVEYMNIEYEKMFGNKLPLWFFRERVHSPKVVARITPDREANLDSIYNVLHIKHKKDVKQIEYDLEIKFAVANPFISEIYRYCRQVGKRIYAISDMYLPQSCIRKMLVKCGYEIDKIYVSQEYNCSKVSGKLFEFFLKEQNLKSSQVIHVGDNKIADIDGANKVGIQAIHIPLYNGLPRYICREGDCYHKLLYKFINNRLLNNKSILERTGYEVLGPVLYYFTKWLHCELNKNNIEKVFFLSRDGYLLKKAYEDLYGESDKVIYLHVSSKSVKRAFENIENQREELIRYLKDMDFKGKVAIVDIGWSGNLHRMIKEVSKEFADVYGFYFGTFSKFRKNVTDGVSRGFLNENRYTRAKIFMSAGFIEILFSDTAHGTVERYESNNEKSHPVISEKNPDGKYLEMIQKGALKFIKDWNESYFRNYEYDTHKLIKPLLDLSINPRVDDVKELGNDYVGSGNNYLKLVGYDNKKYNLSNIKELLIDMQNVAWKGGFCNKNFHNSMVNKVYGIFNPLLILFKV